MSDLSRFISSLLLLLSKTTSLSTNRILLNSAKLYKNNRASLPKWEEVKKMGEKVVETANCKRKELCQDGRGGEKARVHVTEVKETIDENKRDDSTSSISEADNIFYSSNAIPVDTINYNKFLKPQDIIVPTLVNTATNFTELSVPSSSFGRASTFAMLGIKLALQTSMNKLTKDKSTNVLFSPENAKILVETLCRLRGAALKLGQMLSIQDQHLVPPEFAAILEKVRQSANIMPRKQLEQVLRDELSNDWHLKFKSFNIDPIAAASIGQVHEAYLLDGTKVAVKIQYPGVADSISSDLENLRLLVTTLNIFPKGLYIDQILNFARAELSVEVDYTQEAAHQQKYRDLVMGPTSVEHANILSGVYVPKVFPELSSRRIIVQEFVEGIPIDKCATLLSQSQRDSIAFRMMFLVMKELFEWRYVQTDPNWSNFIYDPKTNRLNLLDYGACRGYSSEFINEYKMLVHACANKNQREIIETSMKLRFLSGAESSSMLSSHVLAAYTVGEPFHTELYNFSNSQISAKVQEFGSTMLKERLISPPTEIYSIHRKLAGAFATCVKLGATLPLRHFFYDITKLREPALPKL